MTNWTEICKDCGGCCGVVPIEKDVFKKHKSKIKVPYEAFETNTAIIPLTESGYCVFLTSDKRCMIYQDRTDICKLYGTIEALPCPKIVGELQHKMIMEKQFESFMKKADQHQA